MIEAIPLIALALFLDLGLGVPPVLAVGSVCIIYATTMLLIMIGREGLLNKEGRQR